MKNTLRRVFGSVQWGFVWSRVFTGASGLLILLFGMLWATSEGFLVDPEQYLMRAIPVVVMLEGARLTARALELECDQ